MRISYPVLSFPCQFLCFMITKMTFLASVVYLRRTHSQITQVIREYRKTGYRVPMAVLVGWPLSLMFELVLILI